MSDHNLVSPDRPNCPWLFRQPSVRDTETAIAAGARRYCTKSCPNNARANRASLGAREIAVKRRTPAACDLRCARSWRLVRSRYGHLGCTTHPDVPYIIFQRERRWQSEAFAALKRCDIRAGRNVPSRKRACLLNSASNFQAFDAWRGAGSPTVPDPAHLCGPTVVGAADQSGTQFHRCATKRWLRPLRRCRAKQRAVAQVGATRGTSVELAPSGRRHRRGVRLSHKETEKCRESWVQPLAAVDLDGGTGARHAASIAPTSRRCLLSGHATLSAGALWLGVEPRPGGVAPQRRLFCEAWHKARPAVGHPERTRAVSPCQELRLRPSRELQPPHARHRIITGCAAPGPSARAWTVRHHRGLRHCAGALGGGVGRLGPTRPALTQRRTPRGAWGHSTRRWSSCMFSSGFQMLL